VILKAKKEERENAESCRKAARKKTFKNSCHGQLVLKYWIEHLSQTVQGSIGKSINKDLWFRTEMYSSFSMATCTILAHLSK
jgi:hypothetical protein